MSTAQTVKQKEFESRLKAYGSELAKHQGLSRRRFFQTSSGMAAAFLAMNDTYGPMFGVLMAEMSKERAVSLSWQFIMDMHVHFLHNKTRLANFVRGGGALGRAGWNPALVGKEQILDDLKFANYLMRRWEIPEDMQKKYGFEPLGAAEGLVKSIIFGDNNARFYNYTHAKRAELKFDLLARAKTRYEEQGTSRSNIAYGYMRKVS